VNLCSQLNQNVVNVLRVPSVWTEMFSTSAWSCPVVICHAHKVSKGCPLEWAGLTWNNSGWYHRYYTWQLLSRMKPHCYVTFMYYSQCSLHAFSTVEIIIVTLHYINVWLTSTLTLTLHTKTMTEKCGRNELPMC